MLANEKTQKILRFKNGTEMAVRHAIAALAIGVLAARKPLRPMANELASHGSVLFTFCGFAHRRTLKTNEVPT
jgi:uncharacterized membrane protein YgdD (TMEM256/DUF423 family)